MGDEQRPTETPGYRTSQDLNKDTDGDVVVRSRGFHVDLQKVKSKDPRVGLPCLGYFQTRCNLTSPTPVLGPVEVTLGNPYHNDLPKILLQQSLLLSGLFHFPPPLPLLLILLLLQVHY